MLFRDLRSSRPIAAVHRPGGNEPYEPVNLHARITNRAYERSERGGGLKGWALHDWLQAEQEIRES
ncbi:MAG: DUF2934 domain-containing protein [Nitrospirae bacterium]|nr:MAG: DUF2934 domain-containing protein [Nitrospirota bacterium]